MGDDLEYWQWVLAQREEDLALEIERDEDPYLIMLLNREADEAREKVEELSE